MRLRDYQIDTCASILDAWRKHDSVMSVLFTGGGKTEVFVHLANHWEDGRVLVIAPLITLVSQAAKKITQRTGIAPGIEQAQQFSNEHEYMRSPFIVASKQTLTGKSKRYKRLRDVGLVIVDECHLATTSIYKEMLDYFIERGAKVLGVTATPNRHDGIAMDEMFEHCASNIGIPEGTSQGWLVRCKAHCVQLDSLDLSEVSTYGKKGDFKQGELGKVMETEKVVFEVADVTARESGNLKTVVFCAAVNEAQAVAEVLRDRYGKKADWICGDKARCSSERRSEVLSSFTEDPEGLQFVCNVGVLTTGWDFPGLEHIVQARPTKSLSLHTQIFGRATRPLEGVVDFDGSTAETRIAAIAASDKTHFKMTDLVDNSMEHKIVTSADVLGGWATIQIVERARQNMQNAQEALDVEEALTEAERQLKIEERAFKKKIEEERKRIQRAAIEARANYRSLEVDPFDPNRQAASVRRGGTNCMPFGKHKGMPIPDLPFDYLDWMIKNVTLKEGWLKGSIMKEYRNRTIGLTK